MITYIKFWIYLGEFWDSIGTVSECICDNFRNLGKFRDANGTLWVLISGNFGMHLVQFRKFRMWFGHFWDYFGTVLVCIWDNFRMHFEQFFGKNFGRVLGCIRNNFRNFWMQMGHFQDYIVTVLACIKDTLGIILEWFWHAKSLGQFWYVFRTTLGVAIGVPLGLLWDSFGMQLGRFENEFATILECLWDTFDIRFG